MNSESAKSIDHYEIVEVVHESAAGVVYRAVDSSSDNKVLLKTYYPSLEWSDDVLSEFFNLVSYLRFIEHEYLLPVLEVGKHENRPYVVFADAPSLLANRQPREAGYDETLSFLRHTAEALDFLHKQEILHGTLSPETIALDSDGSPLLFDFGLSNAFRKLLQEVTDEGFENLSIANLRCTSPEQIQGRNPTRASDQYAFGVVGHFFMFGEYPIDALSVSETAAGHLQPGLIRTVQITQNHLREILQLIQKCMQLEPEDRFESFVQLTAALERLLIGKRIRASFSKRFAITKAGNRQPRTWMAYAAGLVLLAILIGGLYFSSRDSNASPPAATLISLPEASPSPRPPTRTPTPASNIAAAGSPTPTAEQSAPPPAQPESAYKPAIERESPLTPSQVISTDNLENLRELSRLGYGKPEEIAVSSSGNTFAFASSAGVYIFNQTQAVGWIDPQGWATSVQFSPDDSILAIGVAKGDIQLWDWRNDVKVATLPAHTDRITRIIFSEGDLMYTASADRSVIVWNWKSHRQILSIPAHARPVNDIAVTSDGRTLFTCSDDGLIRVWDLAASGRKLYELSARERIFSGNIRAIALSPDDLYLAAGGDAGFLYQWKLVTTSAATSLIPDLRTNIVPVKERIWSLQYIRNGQQLFVGVDGGRTLTYDAAREEYEGISLSFQIPPPPSALADVFGAGFEFTSHAVFGQERILTINWDGAVMNQQAQVVAPMFDNLDRLDFSPGGNILAAGGRRGSTHVWNLTTNLPLYKNMYVMPLGDPITPDGSAIVIIVPRSIVTSAGNTVTEGAYQIKNLTGSQSARDLSIAIPNATVGYARDGNVFVAASYDESKTWDFDSGYETFFKHTKYLGCAITASANDDEKLQVTSVSGVLPIWDARADILCPRSQRTEGSLSAISNNLDLLVYINQNGLLEGFDNAQNQTIWQYRPDARSAMIALAVSPDASVVAIGTASGDLIFIDGKTGAFISQITGNYARLQAIEFSDDGKKIATAGADGLVRTFGIVEGEQAGMKNLIGVTVQHYQVLVKIRETPTRILFKSYDTKSQRYTALEVVKGARGDPAELFEQLNSQAQKNSELEHPGIAVVSDAGIHEGIIYFVYDFVPTHPMRRFFNRTYSWQETAREWVSITHALAYAHEKGVWHGFLNPASIVMDEKRNPILFDFGFERIITEHILSYSPGAWVNRWGYEYQPPEQLSGGPADWRADIYAIGMMMHEWLLGRLPLHHPSYIGTMQARKNAEPIQRKKRKEKKAERTILTPVVEGLIRKCIARKPADRYQSMQEVYIVLARGALDMTITKRMVRKPLAISNRRMNPRSALLLLGLVAVMAVTGFLLYDRGGAPASEPVTEAAIPTSTRPAQTAPDTSTPRPTATPQTVDLIPVNEPPRLNTVSLPIFQGESIASIVSQPISPDNADQMVMVSLWGIGEVNRLSASPDGKYLAAASSIGIFILDAQNLELVKYIDTRSWITAIAFSPDGQSIASGDRDGLIQLWSADTWEEFATPLSGHKQAILDLAFSPDSTKLASAALDNILIEWQVNSQASPSSVRLTVPGVTAVVYASDGERIVTGGNDFKINVLESGNLTLLQSLTASAKIVDIAGGANRLVIGGADQRINVLELGDNAALTPLGNMQYPLTSVAISPNGNYYAAGDINGGVTIWDRNNTQVWKSQNYVLGNPASITTPGSPHSLSFSPDEEFLFSGLQNGTVRRLSAATGEESATNRSLNVRSTRLVFSHDSQYAVTQHTNNLLTVWDVWNTQALYQIQGEIKEGDPFAQNNRMFAIAADSDTVKIYESTSGRELYALNNHRDLRTIKFLNSDTRLAAGHDQLMHLWSLSSGQEVKIKKDYAGRGCVTMNDLNDQPLFSITNYQYFVVGGGQSESVLCNFQKLNWTMDINDQGQIAYGGSSKLTVVTPSGEAQEMLGANRRNIVSVALTPNGDVLAAAFDDHTIHLWNVNTREEIFSLFGHDGLITALGFTPDGKLLISVSQDGTIRVWGVPN